MAQQPTIFALSSGPGKAGVAVIRVSGPSAGKVLRDLAGRVPEPRRAELAILQRPGEEGALDRALLLWFPGPRSFTGEDVAELHIHGGRAVIEGVLGALSNLPGLCMAEPGEFTRRAFENGKMDLTAVEGLADLIDAETDAQRRQALRQSGGELGALYEGWRSRLIRALALTESALDFSDEGDVTEQAVAKAIEEAQILRDAIQDHLADRHRGEILRDGMRVVIAGPPNVGKSSLLNALARRDAAIVSEHAGTTRDAIEVRLDLDGFPVIVTDTAGIRKTAEQVEQEGIRRTIKHASQADLILWLMEAGHPDPNLPDDLQGQEDRSLRVLNKIDLVENEVVRSAADLRISCKTGEGVRDLTLRLAAEAAARIGVMEQPAVTRPRHRLELERCAGALVAFLSQDADALELKAEELRQAAQALGRLTGRIDVEDVLGEIFASFCIGK